MTHTPRRVGCALGDAHVPAGGSRAPLRIEKTLVDPQFCIMVMMINDG